MTHATPFVRSIVDEFTVLNETKEAESYLTLEADTYRPRLHVFDSDGGELPYLPNSIVRDTYRAHADPAKPNFDAEAQRRLKAMETRPPKSYFLVVALPPDRSLKSGETRVIRCEWMDPEEPVTTRFSLFSIPEYYVFARIEAAAKFMRHASITAPEGFRLAASPPVVFRSHEGELGEVIEEPEHFHPDIEGPVVHDYAIPSSPFETTFFASYTIQPDRGEYWLFNAFFWGYLGATLVLLLSFAGTLSFVHASLPPLSVTRPFASLVGTGLLAIGVGFLGIVTNPLTHRTKLWTMIPVAVSVAIILLGQPPTF